MRPGCIRPSYPSVPDGTGKWGWLTLTIYENFGVYGLVALWALIGTVLLRAYFSTRAQAADF